MSCQALTFGSPRHNSPVCSRFCPQPRGVPRVDDRRVLSGILQVLRNGLMWRDAPACYGLYKTLYNLFTAPAAERDETGMVMRDAAPIPAHRPGRVQADTERTDCLVSLGRRLRQGAL